VLLGLGALVAPGARAQDTAAVTALPPGDVFRPLLADPKQPRFFAAYVWITSPRLTTQVGSVGLGENIGLLRGPSSRWQVSVAAGVFSQFNMKTPSYDLINTDFIVGLPLSARVGPFTVRLRLYHQSSHLGDEFILSTNPERVNLSFESAELIVSREFAWLRLYGGGEYLVRHMPDDLKPGLLHAGLEVRPAPPLVRLGRLGQGRLVLALDAKSFEQRKWQAGWSARGGLEFSPGTGRRRWSVQLEAYDGPTPFGQFYQDNVSAIGLGLHFSL
jgi:hypothetical protein